MAKLIVEIDCEFKAPQLIWRNKKGVFVPMKSAELKKKLQDSATEDFGFVVTFMDDEYQSPSINFDIPNKSQHKNSVFNYDIDLDAATAKVTLRGSFASGKLRAGVKERINESYADKPLYLDGFIFKGGEWNGFKGPPDGQNEENCLSWHQVKSWTIK
jgi:hypothetical protein